MLGAQWVLEGVLVLLLGATLFHAMRLERALGVLKRDRAVLEELVEGFNESTRQAENGIERLRHAADGAGKQMARQIETAQRLRDDLAFLADRSDRLAERLETAVRSARMVGDSGVLPALGAHMSAPSSSGPVSQAPPLRTQPSAAPMAGRIGLTAVPPDAAQHFAPLPQGPAPAAPAPRHAPRLQPVMDAMEPAAEAEIEPRLRSQAERDLLRALRGAR